MSDARQPVDLAAAVERGREAHAAEAAPDQCVAMTVAGRRCLRIASAGRDICFAHASDGPPPRYANRYASKATLGVVALPPPTGKRNGPRTKEEGSLREHFADICDLVAGGLRPYKAAASLGFSYPALSTLLRIDPDALAQMMAAEAVFAETVEEALLERALAGDTRAAMSWLTNRSKTRWQDARRVELSGSVQHELETGPVIDRIIALQARLVERAARLESGDGPPQLSSPVIEAEVIEP